MYHRTRTRTALLTFLDLWACGRRQYMGFNLMWGNVFADQVEIKCVSNCAVEADDAGRPKIDTLCQGVYGLANDLFGDEFVKVLLLMNYH